MKVLSYMAPSIPHALYQYLSDLMAERLEEEVELWFIETASGPDPPQLDTGSDPYSQGRADIGFQCAPTYVWCRDRPEPRVELVGRAPVFRDPRVGGQPIYYSDVAVSADSPVGRFEDFRGRSWAYNDPQSLSGYYSVLNRLQQAGETGEFFGRTHCSGSHLASIELILAGEIDGTAIDSNVLLYVFRDRPELKTRLKLVDQLGPHGVQPIVMSALLPTERKKRIRDFFEQISRDDAVLAHLNEHYLVVGLETVDDAHYDRERDILRRCGALSLAPKKRGLGGV